MVSIHQGDIRESVNNWTPDGKADYLETLSYIASPYHNGEELRCVVDHIGYSQYQLVLEDNVARVRLEFLCKAFCEPLEV